MNTILKRGLHLGALTALGLLLFTGSRAAATSGAPTPVSVCTTLAANTSYFLTTNISGVGGDCFIVQENTSLDMKGHTISGTGGGSGITDGGNEAANVVIINGT